ncbi:MAG: tRNA (N(6)-L-threonylcarbamoyladenosine(37)-C(2))-methylthiotransferase MtaB [Myxococcales bacterium]|nr:tRNA (N(6)-L-threonylcarbamoyladenosine(37)-C(2))-methylthiotransferase MtaB [Myxococcales bacterium]
MARRFAIKTLGCKANAYDTHLLQQELARRGWSPVSLQEGPDLVVINSCTVTNEADRQSRKEATRAARHNPRARVVMTGCAAEIAPKRMAQANGVHFVVGNQDKARLVDLVMEAWDTPESEAEAGIILGDVDNYQKMKASHPADRNWPIPEAAFLAPTGALSATRAFLKIQEGCDAFCTFCIIPFARGPARSLRPARVIENIRSMEAAGLQEIVLTGTALGDYGSDLGIDVGLDDLVSMILRETTIPRLRISSLDPLELSPGIRRILATNERLCPHVHMSLQSPHSTILRRMKRHYTAEDVKDSLLEIEEIGLQLGTERNLIGGIFVGMDVITGFPGETDEIFQWTYERLSELPWSRLHVFPYSEREGTAALRLDGVVPKQERKRRVRALMDLSTERHTKHCQAILDADAPLTVLLEGAVRGPDGSRQWATGTTSNYLRVLVKDDEPEALTNQHVIVEPMDLHVDKRAGDVALLARIIDEAPPRPR